MKQQKLKELFQISKTQFVESYDDSEKLWQKVLEKRRRSSFLRWPLLVGSSVIAIFLITVVVWQFYPARSVVTFQLVDYTNAYELDQDTQEIDGLDTMYETYQIL